ncbi:MAG: enoyl-CoA hydratase-related protein [Anaerovoracaceae bacterium]
MYKNLKYQVAEGIAYVTISRPDAMNSLNNEVLDELFTAFYRIAKDEDVRVVILTGEGKAFVSGADIPAMNRMDAGQGRELVQRGHNVMNFIESIEKPVIAAINGFALGGGCELAMACDIRVASRRAKLGQPEVGLGIIPGFGGNQRLPKLVGKGMAKYLIFTGEAIKAEKARRIGLVEKIVEPEELMEGARKIAKAIMSKAPLALGAAKTAINLGFDLDMKSASQLEIEAFTGPFASQDKAEGMGAFLEKRKPQFQKK